MQYPYQMPTLVSKGLQNAFCILGSREAVHIPRREGLTKV